MLERRRKYTREFKDEAARMVIESVSGLEQQPSTLRTAARNYQHALDQLTQEAGFAA
jgi:transposase-like protein